MKRMMLTGLVAVGIMAQRGSAQPVPLDAGEIALVEMQIEQARAQTIQADGQVQAMDGQMKAAQAQARNAQTLVKIAQDQLGAPTQPGTYLGIASSPVSAELREQLKLKRGVGLVVQRVEKGSPAEQAGVKQYDIVEKMDDQILLNPDQFQSLVRMQEPGAQVKLAIIRQGQPQTLTVTLVEKAVPVRIGLIDFQEGKPPLLWNENATNFNVVGKGNWTIDQNRDMSITTAVKENVLTLRRENDNMHLIAKDQGGNMLFEGDVNTEEQWNKVPPDIAAEAKRLISRMNIPLAKPAAPTAPRLQLMPAVPVAPQPVQPGLP